MELVRSKGSPVFLTAPAHAGRVVKAYSCDGSGASLSQADSIMTGELTGQKACIKLMVALDVAEQRKYFAD